MSENCFLKQLATSEFISNVASFCSECYSEISENETVYYNMQDYYYVCDFCQKKLQEHLEENDEPLITNSSLIN